MNDDSCEDVMEHRRTKTVIGGVNFPVDDPAYEDTKEGGMFVRLIVVPRLGHDNACCGGHNYHTYDECFISSDDGADERHYFPGVVNPFKERKPEDYDSQPLLAVITIGSTGWSGWNEGKGYFACKYEHLNDAGRALYDALKVLYPDNSVVLQTWLDT